MLTVTATVSRKESENYNSRGCSLTLAAELDSGLLARPTDLQHEIDRLYAEAREAVDRQLGGGRNGGTTGPNVPDNGQADTGKARQSSAMTTAQERAITAIARRLGLDAVEECHQSMGVELDKLDVRQASRFIDHLKALGRTPARVQGGGE